MEQHVTAEQTKLAVHQAKVEMEGEGLIAAALDKTRPHGFHDELAKILDPAEKQEALIAARAYEKQREAQGATDAGLPKVHFYSSEDGELGYVKVNERGINRVVYDADREEGPGKSAKESASDAGKAAGDAVKKLFGHH